jgi:hypothetical protein
LLKTCKLFLLSALIGCPVLVAVGWNRSPEKASQVFLVCGWGTLLISKVLPTTGVQRLAFAGFCDDRNLPAARDLANPGDGNSADL